MISAKEAKEKVKQLDDKDYEQSIEKIEEIINKAITERKSSVDIYFYISQQVIKTMEELGYKLVIGIPSGPNEYRTSIKW